MVRRRPRAFAAASVVVGLLLQLVLVASTAHARPVARSTELAATSAIDATLAPPVKRSPDVVRPERLLRLPAERHAAATRIAVQHPLPDAPVAPGIAPPRARSHAQRLRVRPTDDPPQPAVSA